MEGINTSGINKAALLAALYNASRQQGMGFLHARGATGMTVEQAEEELKGGSYFDYLHGRVMKVDLGGDVLHPGAYDRDNGQGAAAAVVAHLRAKQVA